MPENQLSSEANGKDFMMSSSRIQGTLVNWRSSTVSLGCLLITVTTQFMSPKMKIIDVPRYEHFDNHESPEQSDYFMYGDMKNVFLFHIPAKSSDFYQVTTLC